MFKISEDGKFATLKYSPRVTVVEARGQDWFDWGNDEAGEIDGTVRPAFIAYLGCDNKEQALSAKLTVKYCCSVGDKDIECRSRRNTRTGYPVELKIRNLSRIALEDLISIGDQIESAALYSA